VSLKHVAALLNKYNGAGRTVHRVIVCSIEQRDAFCGNDTHMQHNVILQFMCMYVCTDLDLLEISATNITKESR
jgi:hypothetical protein